MLDEVIDALGVVRRLGSLPVPDDFVSAFPTVKSDIVPWDDADIKRAVLHKDRVPSRVTFADRWITNQQSHGSCGGYAAAGLLSRSRWLRGIQDALIFSGAYPYSKTNGGNDQGSVLDHVLKAIQVHGDVPESLVNWSMIYPKSQPKGVDEEAAKNRGILPVRLESMQELRTCLAMQRPVVVAVHAGSSFTKLSQAGVSGVDNGIGNHAVLVDDMAYVNGDEVYDCPNSWGLGFGIRGRAYLRAEHFAQTMSRHVFYTIGSMVNT